MGAILSEANLAELRATLERAGSSGPYRDDGVTCTSRSERICFVADCVSRTILPRQIEFQSEGRAVLCAVARDARLMGLEVPGARTGEALEALGPGQLALVCETIDAALEAAPKVQVSYTAVDAATDTRGAGLSANELFASAGAAPEPFTTFEALETLVALHSGDLLAVYYGDGTSEQSQISEEVPEDVGQWAFDLLKDAAGDDREGLVLLKHASGHSLALVGHIAEPSALLFRPGVTEEIAQNWSSCLLATCRMESLPPDAV